MVARVSAAPAYDNDESTAPRGGMGGTPPAGAHRLAYWREPIAKRAQRMRAAAPPAGGEHIAASARRIAPEGQNSRATIRRYPLCGETPQRPLGSIPAISYNGFRAISFPNNATNTTHPEDKSDALATAGSP